MMKRFLILLSSLFALTACNSLQQMNSNMQQANELMGENITTMTASKESIEENTVQIQESTASMREFKMILAGVFLLLFIPSIVLYILYFKLIKSIKRLSDKR